MKKPSREVSPKKGIPRGLFCTIYFVELDKTLVNHSPSRRLNVGCTFLYILLIRCQNPILSRHWNNLKDVSNLNIFQYSINFNVHTLKTKAVVRAKATISLGTNKGCWLPLQQQYFHLDAMQYAEFFY